MANFHLKWHYLNPSKIFSPTKVKFPAHSHFEYVSKSFQDDLNQVNNKQTFSDRHLLIPISYYDTFSFVNTFS